MGPGGYVSVDGYIAIMFVFDVGVEGGVTQVRFAARATILPGLLKMGLSVLGGLRVHIIELY